MIETNEKGEPVITRYPECGIKGCGNDARYGAGTMWVCGHHLTEYAHRQQMKERKESEAILENMGCQ